MGPTPGVEQAEQLIELLGEVAEGTRQKATTLREDIESAGSSPRHTQRRVFEGESVPATEKLLSIFEPHTEIICRGKSANLRSSARRYGFRRWKRAS